MPAAAAAGSSTALACSSSSPLREEQQQQEVLLAAVHGGIGGAGRLTELLVSYGAVFLLGCLGGGGGDVCLFFWST